MDVKFNLINTDAAVCGNSLNTADLKLSKGAAKAEAITRTEDTEFYDKKDVSQLSRDDVKNISQELNKFLQLINSDLQFIVHEETKQLIVQVIDTREQRVLKEFPPHELLDTIAKIRDYVGLLIDKKV